MSWNGSGVFSRTDGTRTGATVWAQAKAALVKIIAADHDTHDQDLATGINACLTKNGENSPSANINWGGFKITNLAAGTSSTDAARFGQIKIGQVVSGAIASATGTTTIPFDNTIPQNTEGDQYGSLAITPTNTSSRLIIEVEILLSNDVASDHTLIVALFQDSTANALAAVSQACIQSGSATVRLRHEMAAGTTSATTFKVRAGAPVAGTTRVNGVSGAQLFGGVAASSITIMEVLP
jgi:hypothetical protein